MHRTQALQLQIAVELVEDRLHYLTVAEARARTQVTRRRVSGVRSFSVG
jgi:hypothetical protein